MIVSIKELLKNKNSGVKQCIGCKNPVPADAESCTTCGGEYFVPKGKEDFTHLENELGDIDNIELEI